MHSVAIALLSSWFALAPLAGQAVPSPAAPSPEPAASATAAGATPAESPPLPPAAPPSPTPYAYVYVPPAAIPPSKILEIDMNDRVLHAPGDVRLRVMTAADIISVTVRAMGREIGLPRIAPGLFAADDRIPHVPSWLRGKTYDVQFVAAAGDGQLTTVTLPIDLAK